MVLDGFPFDTSNITDTLMNTWTQSAPQSLLNLTRGKQYHSVPGARASAVHRVGIQVGSGY